MNHIYTTLGGSSGILKTCFERKSNVQEPTVSKPHFEEHGVLFSFPQLNPVRPPNIKHSPEKVVDVGDLH
jgi:hypothetical protein